MMTAIELGDAGRCTLCRDTVPATIRLRSWRGRRRRHQWAAVLCRMCAFRIACLIWVGDVRVQKARRR